MLIINFFGFQLYRDDEASGGSEYHDPINHSLSPNHHHHHHHHHQQHDGAGPRGGGSSTKEDYNGQLTMRDVPDHMSGAQAVCWDGQLGKQSNSGSEVSLACLQGRIQAMEETHYSTHEELQATLQELADLQVQLNEFQAENDKLKEDKTALKRKLEIRTEQFKQARDQVRVDNSTLRRDMFIKRLLFSLQMDSLKQHLLMQCNEAEDERKALQAKHIELNKLLAAQQAEATQREQQITWLTARVYNYK